MWDVDFGIEIESPAGLSDFLLFQTDRTGRWIEEPPLSEAMEEKVDLSLSLHNGKNRGEREKEPFPLSASTK